MAEDPTEKPVTSTHGLQNPHLAFCARNSGALVALALVLAVLAAYSRVFGFGFVNLDDGPYVYSNSHLRSDSGPALLRWIFFSFDPDNWFPLTRLSLLLDYRVFGLRSNWYHAENVLLHVLASVLLFGFLRRATLSRGPSAFVAAVFALHPLHVESVAWISERKDVLCALFWFASLWYWLRYTESPGFRRYLAALLFFVLGLMSKPMIVTLPFLLLLLDFWPLRRAFSARLILEKIPFFAVSATGIALTLAAQQAAGATRQMDVIPLSLRLQNAPVAVVVYLADAFWPLRLWTAHVYPNSLNAWQVIAAVAGILVISVIALSQKRARPWLATGWFWFLGTLIPVIGFVQVGPQPYADRYMYVPLVGLAIAIAWLAAEIAPRIAAPAVFAALPVMTCMALAWLTWHQTAYWSDTESLLQHALEMDSNNYRAWLYRGHNLESNPNAGPDVIACYQMAVSLNPESAEAHNILAIALAVAHRYAESAAQCREAIRIYPRYAAGHFDLAYALSQTGQDEEAIREWETALSLNPSMAQAHYYLGLELHRNPARSAEALAHLEKSVALDPNLAPALFALGKIEMGEPGRLSEAISHLSEGLRVAPLYLPAQVDLAEALLRAGRTAEAVSHLQAAQAIRPDPERAALLERLERATGAGKVQ
jgi:tetratricopeptide (TPR) repeat protein